MLRRTFMLRAASVLALPLIALAAAPARPVADTSTTIIVVRHGEKAAEPREDPVLSPAGEARAMALVDAVKNAGVSAIYSTGNKRTQFTVRPLSEATKVPVTTFDVNPGDPAYGGKYAAEILSKQRGKVVLVVGHSNTIPLILRGLGVADPPAMPDSEYDTLYVVTVPETGPARMVRARFGAENH